VQTWRSPSCDHILHLVNCTMAVVQQVEDVADRSTPPSQPVPRPSAPPLHLRDETVQSLSSEHTQPSDGTHLGRGGQMKARNYSTRHISAVNSDISAGCVEGNTGMTCARGKLTDDVNIYMSFFTALLLAID